MRFRASTAAPPTWGRFEVRAARHGGLRQHLVVLAPGTAGAEARRFGWWSEFSWLGVAGAELVFALAASAFGPSIGIATTGCAYLVGFALVQRASARSRAGARALTERLEPSSTSAAASRCVELAMRLRAADDDVRAGRIDLVAHERVWSEVWEQLGSDGTR